MSTPTVEAVERIFTWGVSFSYLCGFASMYIQNDGLQGNKGIIPMSKCRLKYTSRLFNNKQFKKKPDMVIDILCLSGMILSFSSVVHRKYRTMLDMSLLWYRLFQCCFCILCSNMKYCVRLHFMYNWFFKAGLMSWEISVFSTY